ncbi:MAG: S1 RNA-binding domain-containing protein [Lachnospiraceae bacterium]|nr:S1 RNA-binding domain-containing protein [Lachnospiraceae bacterium]
MIELGKTQPLMVVRKSDYGIYLGDSSAIGKSSEENEVLLPNNQVPRDIEIGDTLNVFVYKDSEDRPVATTTTPALELGQVALLRVIENTKIGAFLDWGLPKDLLLPYKEQTAHIKPGDEILIALYLDKSSRLCGTMNVYNYLSCDAPYVTDDHVTGRVYETSDNYGVFVAVDDKYSGLIPKKELIKDLKPGDLVQVRVTSVTEEGRLNLSLRERTHIQMDADSSLLLSKLEEAGGFLPYHDKSDPDIIKREFSMSKAAFKRAIGRLYKNKQITIEHNGIRKVQ